jgi:Rad3-related DNA helicase
MMWREWALNTPPPEKKAKGTPDLGYNTMIQNLGALRSLPDTAAGDWIVTEDKFGYHFQPVWGAPFVMLNLMGHETPPPNADLFERAAVRHSGVRKTLFTSATLMGAEYIAETLGLPDGSWAYLDLPSTFPVANRPINFSPVDGMNATKLSTPEGRAKMQRAIDSVIEYYVLNGRNTGVVHSVSNKYRDIILTESRWQGIMTSDRDEHESNVKSGKASILVAANVTEGWDGYDDLCRFVIMPKVPFPSLGDKRTVVRKDEDQRSYDHRALVSVVQGAGRGVRHREDYGDCWILDRNWRMLMGRRGDWLPEAFTSAYHHNVELPNGGSID